MVRTGKIRTDWPARFGKGVALPGGSGRRVLLHAVSVGEVNAIDLLVETMQSAEFGMEPVVSSMTDTGYRRAKTLFAGRCEVVRWPFDATFAVERLLDRVGPDAVGLVELEVWPNFLRSCARRDIPVAVVNGRLSGRSHRRYRKLGSIGRRLFSGLQRIGVQDEVYAERFRSLGLPPDRIVVTGSMKWDTARIADEVDGADALAEAMGIDRNVPLVVAGSTAPEEHRLLCEAMPAGVQLLCAPRKPEWFDAAARTLAGCARRSTGTRGSSTGRFLLDTIGELRAAYGLADIVVVGRTFVDLGGSDMIEPVALGRPTVIGPDVRNFEVISKALIDAEGVVQTDAADLGAVIESLLSSSARGIDMTTRGRACIRERQGATHRHAALLAALLGQECGP